MRPAIEVIGDSVRACTTRRIGCRFPSDNRISGRTITSNTTSALTGLAGNRKVGTPSRPSCPKPWTEPGCMATRVTSISPSSASTASHRLGRRAADRAGDHHDLGAIDLALNDFAEFSCVAADDADPVHLRAGVAGSGRQRVGVDVVNLSVARACARCRPARRPPRSPIPAGAGAPAPGRGPPRPAARPGPRR